MTKSNTNSTKYELIWDVMDWDKPNPKIVVNKKEVRDIKAISKLKSEIAKRYKESAKIYSDPEKCLGDGRLGKLELEIGMLIEKDKEISRELTSDITLIINCNK